MNILRSVRLQNEYSNNVRRKLRPMKHKTEQAEENKFEVKSYVPSVKETTGKLEKILKKQKIETKFTSKKNLKKSLLSVKTISTRKTRVYETP